MLTSKDNNPSLISQAFTQHRCICCGHEGRWMPYLPLLVKCPRCGFVRAAKIDYTRQELEHIYSETYFRGEEYQDYPRDADKIKADFRRLLPHVLKLVSGGRMLEIGCAYGFWMEVAGAHFEVTGVDISAAATAFARERGLDARTGDFIEIDLPKSAYDVCCMWDTIEHLAYPERYMEKITQLLKPGGWLLLTTGDIGALVARVQGRHWSLIHPPTHLQYFSRHTIPRFLSRFAFTEIQVQAESVYLSLAQVLQGRAQFSSNQILKRLFTFTRDHIPLRWQEMIGAEIRLGDLMFVAARRTQ